MAHPTGRMRLKLNRAKQHIEEFDFRSRRFYATNPCRVRGDDDSKRGQRVWTVDWIAEVPDDLALATADALQNLRSPLDYIATRIETKACGAEPKHRVYFPIGRSAAHYQTVRGTYIKCAGQAAIDAFDATEPYRGGKGHALWQLNELNKPDKHELPLTVAAGYSAFDLAPMMRDTMREHLPDIGQPDFSLYIRPADRRCPLQVGDVLLREPLDPKVQEDRKFLLDVSFHEPGVIECEPVLPTLKNLANLVDGIVTAFEPLL